MTTEKAILAGGCFWGMQDLIRKFPWFSPYIRRRCPVWPLRQ
jgi:hypothetical protein